MRGIGEHAVYHRAMGLFRNRAKKNREKAAADLPKEPDQTAKEQVEVARPEVTAEQRPNPDQPGWGMALGQEIGRTRAGRPGGE